MNRKNILCVLLLVLMACSPAYSAQTFREQLANLEGVVSIDEVVQSVDVFAEKYIAWFEQPLDWASPDIGKFLQRVEIGFQDYDRVNVVNVDGYALSTSYINFDDRHELARMYNANYINVEYRYFDKSIPEGLSEDKTALWEYLTDENASYDFHNIIEQLRGILSGTWVFTGASKGGQAANVFSYYFPNDADAYVAYVAPFCDGTNDPRLMEAVYTTIGTERYGEAQAKIYRDMVLEFQVEAVRNRDYVQPLIVSADTKPRWFGNASKDFEAEIIDYAVGVWQYDQEFASIDQVLKMPRQDNPDTQINERTEYLNALAKLIKDSNPPSDVSIFPYYYQAATENGHYRLKTQYLREALASEGLSMYMTEADEIDREERMKFTEEQYRLFTFDPYMRNELLAWSHTTQSNVIMIYGNSDPWYFVRLPDVDDNPNVHIFTTTMSHVASIMRMPEGQRAQVTALLNEWLMADAVLPSGGGSSSGGSCNSGMLPGYSLLCVFIALKAKRK